jgi:hypothetical protein
LIEIQSVTLKASINDEQGFQEPRSSVVRRIPPPPDQRFFFSLEGIRRVERAVNFFPPPFRPYIKLPLLSVCLFVEATVHSMENNPSKR